MRKSHASLISWLLAGALPVPATTKLDKGQVRFRLLQPFFVIIKAWRRKI